ncbi:MAG: S8 family serine peptidase [Candidatus Kapaibacterium sp.]|nr:S8 family serine peptidase [Bacteroidota bacterium]
MKTFLLSIYLLVAVFGVSLAQQKSGIKPGTIVIKFKTGSTVYQQWYANGRSGSINEFKTYLGTNTSRAYLSEELIRTLENRHNAQFNAKGTGTVFNNLYRLAIVNFSSAVDPAYAARKISTLADVEYAEPMYERYITYTPNDTLYSFQYHLAKIKATDAWDIVKNSTDSVLVGVVDTGVEYAHEDLKDVIYFNQGEMGLDKNGKDKSTNRVDDDNNGYVDDFRGWDFIGFGTPYQQDNDPQPGNGHGTHVAGLIGAKVNNITGVAGVCDHARIIPIKCGGDPSFSSSVDSGYAGIAYAAALGAKIVNCSWGGPNHSEAEQEVITAVHSIGTLVVAAAGNDSKDQAFYPAAYTGVLSVTASDGLDRKSFFSNYGYSSGIASPGSNIFSTYRDNTYQSENGTSMASPIVAGAAAMVKLKFPTYSPNQIKSLLMATADNIDTIKSNAGKFFTEKMGTGRVNVLKALTTTNTRWVNLTQNAITDEDGDGAFNKGNTVFIQPTYTNVLSPIENAIVKVKALYSGKSIQFTDTMFVLGALSQNETKQVPGKFSFKVPNNFSADTVISLALSVYDGTTLVGHDVLDFTINPTYVTLKANNLWVTVNSNGNYAYNDYPSNNQGEGLKYKQSSNLLFEGSLMIAYSPAGLSNVARDETGNAQSKSFNRDIPISIKRPGIMSTNDADCQFSDNGFVGEANVSVHQKMLQYNDSGREDFVIAMYDIVNMNKYSVDSMYCGIYCDWDLGPGGKPNLTKFDVSDGIMYAYNTALSSLPYVGMQLISNQQVNAFMMDNDGTTAENPGVYDGFTYAEKWQTLSSGIGRVQSNETDASSVISAGPMKMKSGDTARVVFSIFAGQTLAELKTAAEKARKTLKDLTGINPGYTPPPPYLAVTVNPNPINDIETATITLKLPKQSYVSCDIVDLFGNTVSTLLLEDFRSQGEHTLELESAAPCICGNTLAQGTYLVRLRTTYGTVVEPFIIIR